MDRSRKQLSPSLSIPHKPWCGKALGSSDEPRDHSPVYMTKHLRTDGDHTLGPPSAAGLCSFAKINNSPSTMSPSSYCIPLSEMPLTSPFSDSGVKKYSLPRGVPMFSWLILPRPSQRAQCVSLTFWMVFRRQNGALLILRRPKRERKGQGGGRVRFLRS